MSRNPHYPGQNPIQNQNPNNPNPFYNPSESDMDHYNNPRDVYQSDPNMPGGQYDNQNYDPYGMSCVFFYFFYFSFCPRALSIRRNSTALHTAQRRADTDTESEQDVYNRNYAPSAESLNPGFRSGVSDISNTAADYGAAGVREPYPAWTSERQIPLSKECVSFQPNPTPRRFIILVAFAVMFADNGRPQRNRGHFPRLDPKIRVSARLYA
jgi:hypothetical protein